MPRLTVLLIAAFLSGCSCSSTTFGPCHRMTWVEMCKKGVACRACLRDTDGRDREEAARACWERVNGR